MVQHALLPKTPYHVKHIGDEKKIKSLNNDIIVEIVTSSETYRQS